MIEIDFESLGSIGLTPYIAQQLLQLETATADVFSARIVEIHGEWMLAHSGQSEYRVRALPALGFGLAVGDWVIVESRPNNEYWISQCMEPVTQISRRTQEGKRQVLVTNVDTALLVMGLDKDFNLRRMERYLAIVQAAQVIPVIVLTKQDIAENLAEKLEQIEQRLPAHIPIVAVNALHESTIMVLAPWLRKGQTLVLLGSSGAGKSTLTNRLTSSAQATGDVRKDDSKGRHTTTSRSLHQCTTGACIIDTPGLRSWSPDVDEESLELAFDDIATLAMNCRFRNCEHRDEPGCAVREFVDADRLHNYQKLLREVRRSQQTALERIDERAKWKVLHKAAQVRVREKRGDY
ncbi:ribosome small subunit-dependent GTPase A [Cellvibrio sp. UBA7671]|uniref:ribosome small subunit-dependent GTPase A n=1 Tax=Cellvibrio sp. UBA7671 TaxID=1946312 RepID=UPI002F3568A8